MNDTVPEKHQHMAKNRPVVAAVLSSDRVVINKGEKDGIMVGQRFLIYELDEEEIVDPVTKESLGRLEEPKGTGRVVSVQDRMAVVESDKERGSSQGLGTPGLSISDLFTPAAMAPFRNPNVGDLLKRV